MEDFRFAQSQYLLLLLLLPVLGWGLARLGRNARERLLRFVSAANLEALLRVKGTKASSAQSWLFWLGLALLIVALARPQANPETEEMQGASLDIYVLLDVSKSMDAEDIAPSRLKKAKREITSLMSLLAGDRVGLIAFAGSSVIVSPLTSDYEVVRTFLQNIDTSLIQNQTTNIQGALALAEEAMKRGAERTGTEGGLRSNVFVVMSDGEDQAQDPDYSVVESIQKAGGTIFTIAFGTEAGGKIPVRNDRGELLGYKRERGGVEVTTKVQPKSLEEIARLGGGQFYFSTSDEGEIRDILNRMQSMQRTGAVMMKARVYQEYFWPVLAVGMLLVLSSFFSLGMRLPKIPLSLARKSAVLALLVPLSAEASVLSYFWDKERRASDRSATQAAEGKPEEAVDTLKGLLAENPDSAPLNYNVGTYLLNGKKGDQGREQLQRLTQGKLAENPLKYRSLFNIAGSYATEGKKDEARAGYAEIIRDLAPRSELSKENAEILNLAKQNLARLADPKQDPQKQNEQNQQNQQNQQQNQGNEGQQKQDGQNKPQDQKGEQKDSKASSDQNKEQKESGEEKDKKEDGKPEDKKDGKEGGQDEKKEDQPGKDGKDQEQPKPEDKPGSEGKEDKPQESKSPPQYGRRAFKERQDLAEEDAKRLLDELKLHETGLQKKFLKKKEGDKFGEDVPSKDW